ncbi:hypothetical protein JCM3765_001525 [Sporobolomyces pararoseus]
MSRPPPLLPLLPPGTLPPILPRHLRSTLGRRPPFNLLTSTVSIDSMSLEEVEFADAVSMEPYNDGVAVGGRKGWNDEHERLMDWFYQPGSPCFVDPRFPLQHSGYLSPEAVDVRARGRPAIDETTESLTLALHKSSFSKQYVDPWLSLKKKKQRQLLLAVLADLDCLWPTFQRNRKLLAEVVVEDLLADGGKGLVDLFDQIRDHLGLNDLDLLKHPLPNEKFFRKFGIVDDQQLPADSSDRAFQEEYLMRRHSLLFTFVDWTLQRILGNSAPASESLQPIASTASDVTRNSELPSTFGSPDRFFVAERCTNCSQVARNAETKQLLMCLKCKKNVDRIQIYCSVVCQQEHWPRHKKDCGKSIRDIHPISTPTARPISPPSTASKTSKPLPVLQTRLRSFIRKNLVAYPEEFWFYHTSRGPVRMGSNGWGDDAKGLRIRKAMRKLVLDAIDGDSHSIDLVCFVLEAVFVKAPFGVGTTQQDLKLQPRKTDTTKDEGVEHMRETFGLEKEIEWEEAKRRGKLALKNKGNEAVKELYDGTLRAAHIYAILGFLKSLLEWLTGHGSD